MPGGNATLGLLQSNTFSDTSNYGVRARQELKLNPNLTAVAGIGWETTNLKGINTVYRYNTANVPTATIGPPITADRQFQNTAPELALVYKLNPEWQFRGRVATGYGTPQVGNLFVLSNGQNGNNTQLKTQQNLGYDLGFDWTPNNTLTLSATGFYEFFKNELVTQATQVGALNASFTFNAPKSEHRGVEIAADWKFYPGWRFTAAYTYLDEVYTEYTENITNGAVFSFNRAGNKIPGISPNELTARLGYDQMWGPLAGLGAFVEVQWKDSFYMDNANLLKAPGYELVNLNVHYKTDLDFRLFQVAEPVLRSQERVRPDLCRFRQQHRQHGHASRRSKPRERAGEHHRFDLRRFAARVLGRNEGGIQMIEIPQGEQAMLRMGLLATLAFALCQTAAYAQMSHHQHASEAACEDVVLRCASKVTPAFASDGTLWLAWMAGGQISVASSNDAGRSFSTPVQVTKEKLNLDWGPDARPQIVVEKNGGIALAFSLFRDKAFNGQVLTTRSTDGGRSFAELKPITSNNESQRFVALGLDADGSVFAAWIDKRNRVPAKQKARSTRGQGCSSRRRKTVARPIPRRGWQATILASAAGSDLPSPAPAVPWSCSGTSLRAVSGITRS